MINFETIQQIHTALETYLELPPLFEAILALFPELGSDFGSIILQEEKETLHFQSTIPGQEGLSGPSGRRYADRLVKEGLVGKVLKQGKPEIVANLAQDPRDYHADYLIESCRGAILIPIQLKKAQGQGVIIFGSKRTNAYAQNDLLRFETVTWQFCQSIESTLLFRTQAENSRQLALINEVSQAATSILNVGVMLATVTQAVQRSFGFHRVSIYRYMPANNMIRLDAYTGNDGRTFRPEKSLARNEGLIFEAIKQQCSLAVDDLRQSRYYQADQTDTNVKSMVAIPIKLGIKPIAILSLESNRLDTFEPRLVSALEVLTDQLAIAIENARLYDDLRSKINELISLNNISQAVSSSLDLHQTLTLVTEHVIKTLNVEATSVVLRDDPTNEIWFAAASGAGSTQVLGLRIPLGVGIAGWVSEQGEPIIVPDVQADKRFLAEVDKQSGFTTKSILCVPLKTKGRLIGAIEAINKRDDSQFTIQDLTLVSNLTAPAATAIENAQLYEDLAHNIKELEDTQAKLIQSAKLNAIGELAAGMAHEINNPLTSIIGLSKMMMDDFLPNSEEAEDLDIIHSEAQRASRIVKGLLDFSRVEEPIRTLTNLNQILQEAALLVLTESVRHKITLIEAFSQIPDVFVDANQIKQVLINILNNAVHVMPDGGQVTITSKAMSVDAVDNQPNYVKLSIEDTGGGIDPMHQDKIFDPFFTTKDVGQGTGLGLSVSYGIIESHNGQIQVQNKWGEGAIFHIILPILNVEM
ncbi:MAG: GAF domain-containing protein [Chloroflexota bacterium]